MTDLNPAVKGTEQNWMNFSEDDLRDVLRRVLWTVGILTVLVAPVLWAKAGWRDLVTFLIGAAISASGVYEWQQLMTVVMARMEENAAPRPMGRVLTMFFLRLAVAAVLLYICLKSLDGSVYALLLGLSLGLIALFFQAIRLLRLWRV